MGVFLTLHNLLFWSQSLLSSCISKAQMLFILLPYTVNDSVVFHFMICIHCSVKKHENARDDSGSSCLLSAVGRKPFTLHLVQLTSHAPAHTVCLHRPDQLSTPRDLIIIAHSFSCYKESCFVIYEAVVDFLSFLSISLCFSATKRRLSSYWHGVSSDVCSFL